MINASKEGEMPYAQKRENWLSEAVEALVEVLATELRAVGRVGRQMGRARKSGGVWTLHGKSLVAPWRTHGAPG